MSLSKIEELYQALNKSVFETTGLPTHVHEQKHLKRFLDTILRVRKLEVALEVARREMNDAKNVFKRSQGQQ